ncbi:PHB depolymerase family esterase [Kitasatospora sp. NPDC048722]|uniref:extracellular catalytic domain type 1 short-chain-length polyhydroxyalkanoate depolymerase n=1 Tax=Kitasatospora sp. NPDC048722 TaxID=3155639 RepID=UPI0033CE6152
MSVLAALARTSAAALLTAGTLSGTLIAGTATASPAAVAAATVSPTDSAADSPAGTFQQVTGFGSNPGNLAMYAYTPAGLPTGAPLVVALHGCLQTASDYYQHSGWAKFADLYGFAVVFPQTNSSNNSLSCFSWFDAAKDARGTGEAGSVAQMVAKAETLYGSDGHRVYVTGLSAGGGLAADLLADYPDVFAGGAIDAGLPAHCATTLGAAAACQNTDQGLTPAQWGDKVRSADPGYAGPWPRVAVWQGTSDTVVRPVNATELRDQWTNVWGLPQSPTSSRSLPGGTTEDLYADPADPSGRPAVAVYSVAGMGHGLAVDPGSGADQCGATGSYFLDTICSSYYTAQFWGLSGGGGPTTPGLPAPAGLTASAAGPDSIALSWQAVSGAASYQVLRDGSPAGTATGTSFTDTGLAPGTSYTYTVAAVDASGTLGAKSAAVTASTSGGAPRCFTDNNYAQVQAGRATQSGGLTYALGSGQSMGLWNTFVTHTLRQTGPGYYVLADGEC